MCLGREETFKGNTSVLNLRPSPLISPPHYLPLYLPALTHSAPHPCPQHTGRLGERSKQPAGLRKTGPREKTEQQARL